MIEILKYSFNLFFEIKLLIKTISALKESSPKVEIIFYILLIYFAVMLTVWCLWWTGLAIQWTFMAFFNYVVGVGLIVSIFLMAYISLSYFSRSIIMGYSGELLDEVEPDNPDDDQRNEPAYKLYFFERAMSDLKAIIKENFKSHKVLVMPALYFILAAIITLSILYFVNPEFSGMLMFLFATVPLTVVIAFTLSSFCHAMIILGVSLSLRTFAFIISSIEKLSLKLRSTFYTCIHPECYKPITIPVFECRTCFAKHKRLVPSEYGIFKRKCACGEYLPTTDFFKVTHNNVRISRSDLQAICPHEECAKDLNFLEGTSIHIPIIGSANVGKSTFITSMLIRLRESLESFGSKIEFPDINDQKMIADNISRYDQGIVLDKTRGDLGLKSIVCKISTPKKEEVSLYLYDIPGEVYQNDFELGLQHQKYLEYSDGIIFIIDPIALRGQEDNVTSEDERFLQDPDFVFDRFRNGSERILSPNNKWSSFVKKPFNIVISKADRFGIEKTIDDENTSDDVKKWIESNQGAGLLVRIESYFKHTYYHACSALGFTPSLDGSNPSFVPKGTLFPIRNILRSKGFDPFKHDKGFSFKSKGFTDLASLVLILGLLAPCLNVAIPYSVYGIDRAFALSSEAVCKVNNAVGSSISNFQLVDCTPKSYYFDVTEKLFMSPRLTDTNTSVPAETKRQLATEQTKSIESKFSESKSVESTSIVKSKPNLKIEKRVPKVKVKPKVKSTSSKVQDIYKNIASFKGKVYIRLASSKWKKRSLSSLKSYRSKFPSHTSFIHQVRVKGKYYHRIYLGPFDSIKDAKDFKKSKKLKGIVKTL